MDPPREDEPRPVAPRDLGRLVRLAVLAILAAGFALWAAWSATGTRDKPRGQIGEAAAGTSAAPTTTEPSAVDAIYSVEHTE